MKLDGIDVNKESLVCLRDIMVGELCSEMMTFPKIDVHAGIDSRRCFSFVFFDSFIKHRSGIINFSYTIFFFCNKKQYLDLLLLADEQESMIDRYLERGDMFVLADNNEVKALCVITEEGKGI